MRSAMLLAVSLAAQIGQTAGAQSAAQQPGTSPAPPLVTLRQGNVTTLGPSGARIHAEADRDAYLTVLVLSAGDLRVIYPRTPRATSRVRAGQDVGITVPALPALAVGSSQQAIHVVAIASAIPFDYGAYRSGSRWKEPRLIGYAGTNPDEVVEAVAELLLPDADVPYSYDVATYYPAPLARYGSGRYGYDQCGRYGTAGSRHQYDEAFFYGDPFYFDGYPRQDLYYFLMPAGSGWYLNTPVYARGYSRCGGSPIRFTILLPPRRGRGGPDTGRPDTAGVPRDPDDRRVAWDSATWERPGSGAGRGQPAERGTFSGGARDPRGRVTRVDDAPTGGPTATRTDESTGPRREVERKETPRRDETPKRERPARERTPARTSAAEPARAEPRRSAPAARPAPSRPAAPRAKKAD